MLRGLDRSVWKPRLVIFLLIALAISGAVLLLYTTEIAPWAYSDSAAYITTAKNIAAGRGIVLQNPSGHFDLLPRHPPLYPLAISLPMLFGAGALQAARWLNVILFAATIFLVGWMAFTSTRSLWLAISAAALILYTYEPLRAFSGVMSEGLFIFLVFASLFALNIGLKPAQESRIPLVWSGIAAALAILTRYIGLFLLPVGIISILIIARGEFRLRLQKTLAFIIPAVILPLLWFVPVFLTSETLGNWHWIAPQNIPSMIKNYGASLFNTIGSWLPFFYRGNHIIPPGMKLFLGLGLIIGLASIGLIMSRKRKRPVAEGKSYGLIVILTTFIAVYMTIHFATYLFASTQPDANGRLFLPVYITSILLLAIIFKSVGGLVKPEWIVAVAFALLAGVTIWYFHGKMYLYTYDMHHFGDGYTSKRWNENPIFQEIASLQTARPMASNDPSLILFYTGRFPDQIKLSPDQKTFLLDLPDDEGLVLFKLRGEEMIGSAYDSVVTSAKERYQVVYEDKEGIVFQPR